MTRSFKVFLLLLLGVPALIAILVGSNFLLCIHLLHLDRNLVARARPDVVAVVKPLVLKVDERGDRNKWARWLLPQLGVEESATRLPVSHPLLVDISWIQRANPYTPLLAEFSKGYGLNYCSFGYIGADGAYHQITVYSGEADSMPSPLVRKVRGEWTHAGDYFVAYLFLLSWKDYSKNYPQIDHIEWDSSRGGSYNGFEEIVFNAVATLVELCLIFIVVLVVFLRRRSSRRSAR